MNNRFITRANQRRNKAREQEQLVQRPKWAHYEPRLIGAFSNQMNTYQKICVNIKKVLQFLENSKYKEMGLTVKVVDVSSHQHFGKVSISRKTNILMPDLSISKEFYLNFLVFKYI